MPRDMTGTGRYPPNPFYRPISFYSAVRLGDPEQLAKVMQSDPYFVTQDNGAGAPLHFATTYRQLDMSRGADPSIRTEDYDPYLNPGRHLPVDVCEDAEVKMKLKSLEDKYASTKRANIPHVDIGCWWTLYDYGLDQVKTWKPDYQHPYPEELRRQKDEVERKKAKAERRRRKAAAAAASSSGDQPVPAVEGSRLETTSALQTSVPVPKTSIAFLFPGQGSQALGMLKMKAYQAHPIGINEESKDLPAVKQMLEKAKAILGYDLLDICLNGPKEKLDDTSIAQPALFVAGLAAVERLRSIDPRVVDGCSTAAGLSLGEYCALVFAGAMSFEDGLKVVKVRGESMAAAARAGPPHGMLSIIGLGDAEVEAICAEVRSRSGSDTVCQMANYLFPQGRVISGHKVALEMAMAEATKKGALKAVPLAVSGAFHTKLMQPARDSLLQVLSTVKVQTPRIPTYSNVTAALFPEGPAITAVLGRQLVEPVQWESILKALVSNGKTELYELGPGAQIKAMMKRIDTNVWKAFKNTAA